jgi:hypothetical protein
MKERFDWRIKVAEIFERTATRYIDRSVLSATGGDTQKEEKAVGVAQSFLIRAQVLRNQSEKLKDSSKKEAHA